MVRITFLNLLRIVSACLLKVVNFLHRSASPAHRPLRKPQRSPLVVDPGKNSLVWEVGALIEPSETSIPATDSAASAGPRRLRCPPQDQPAAPQTPRRRCRPPLRPPRSHPSVGRAWPSTAPGPPPNCTAEIPGLHGSCDGGGGGGQMGGGREVQVTIPRQSSRKEWWQTHSTTKWY